MINIEIRKQVLRGPGALVVRLDPGQCFPADPGAGEPIIIACGRASSTFCCARNEGWRLAEGGWFDVELTHEQCQWLDSVDGDLSDWLAAAFRLAEAKGVARKN